MQDASPTCWYRAVKIKWPPTVPNKLVEKKGIHSLTGILKEQEMREDQISLMQQWPQIQNFSSQIEKIKACAVSVINLAKSVSNIKTCRTLKSNTIFID
jgi:hypothetical protein